MPVLYSMYQQVRSYDIPLVRARVYMHARTYDRIYFRREQDEKDLIKSLEMLKANFANCKERLGADNKYTKECLELLLEVTRAKARNARP